MRPAPKPLTNLADIADRYDAVFCDIWGVIHNGRGAFPAAVHALRAWRERGGAVILISNVPKPRAPIFGQLERLGAPRTIFDTIVTSGDAIRAELSARAPGPYVRIGPPDDGALWDGLNLETTLDMNAATFVAISGLDDPLKETPADYRPRLARAAERRLPLLCANPDKQVRIGDRLVWCAGAVAEVYAAMGGTVVMAGKPFAPIYALAFQELSAVRAGIPAERVLCIGDGIGTDIKGANAADLDVLFIAHGVHGDSVLTAEGLDMPKLVAALERDGAHAHFAMTALA